jgi:hypothetical protein
MRVVASLTTTPDHYYTLIKTLQCLNKQTYSLDAIYLSLPRICKRLNTKYPPLPKNITKLCTIVPCEDFGPITKIMGGLLMENDPETIIITFDDDMIYYPTTVELLLKHHKEYPSSAICSSGMLIKYNCPVCAIKPNINGFIYNVSNFHIPPEGRKVDVMYGLASVLYLRKFFPKNEHLERDFLSYALTDENTFLNDDIIISGYLSLKNISRRIFNDIPKVDFVTFNNVRERKSYELSYNTDRFFSSMNLAIDKCKKLGMFKNIENMTISETVVGTACFIFVPLIILISIIVYALSK